MVAADNVAELLLLSLAEVPEEILLQLPVGSRAVALLLVTKVSRLVPLAVVLIDDVLLVAVVLDELLELAILLLVATTVAVALDVEAAVLPVMCFLVNVAKLLHSWR